MAGFVVGIVLGFLVIGLAGIIAALFIMSLTSRLGRFGPWIICLAELVAFVLVLLAAFRTKRRGLPQGVLTGGALALLICAACWGLAVGGLFRIGG